jgi:hypothetical protein
VIHAQVSGGFIVKTLVAPLLAPVSVEGLRLRETP